MVWRFRVKGLLFRVEGAGAQLTLLVEHTSLSLREKYYRIIPSTDKLKS